MSKKLEKKYISKFYGIPVRKEIVKEFTRVDGTIDDFMAGLHEVRARMAEKFLRSLAFQ